MDLPWGLTRMSVNKNSHIQKQLCELLLYLRVQEISICYGSFCINPEMMNNPICISFCRGCLIYMVKLIFMCTTPLLLHGYQIPVHGYLNWHANLPYLDQFCNVAGLINCWRSELYISSSRLSIDEHGGDWHCQEPQSFSWYLVVLRNVSYLLFFLNFLLFIAWI